MRVARVRNGVTRNRNAAQITSCLQVLRSSVPNISAGNSDPPAMMPGDRSADLMLAA